MSQRYTFDPEQVHPTALIVPGAVVIGDVRIARDVSIWYNATLYNYAETAQTVRLTLAPQAGLTLLDAPDTVVVAPDGIATATFTLRADAAGTFALQLTAAGEDVVDAVEQQIVVTAP